MLAAVKPAAAACADEYAPEHLEVQARDLDWYLGRLRNYGSLFLGEESTVAYSDKTIGTNHILPTGRAASRRVAPVVARICEIEGMLAHKATADLRARRYGDGAAV